jgi:hypothetical protein
MCSISVESVLCRKSSLLASLNHYTKPNDVNVECVLCRKSSLLASLNHYTKLNDVNVECVLSMRNDTKCVLECVLSP